MMHQAGATRIRADSTLLPLDILEDIAGIQEILRGHGSQKKRNHKSSRPCFGARVAKRSRKLFYEARPQKQRLGFYSDIIPLEPLSRFEDVETLQDGWADELIHAFTDEETLEVRLS